MTTESTSHRNLPHGEATIEEECTSGIKPVLTQQSTERQFELFLYDMTGSVRAQMYVSSHILQRNLTTVVRSEIMPNGGRPGNPIVPDHGILWRAEAAEARSQLQQEQSNGTHSITGCRNVRIVMSLTRRIR